jgi:hypothetical protein
MGSDATFGLAFAKSQLAASNPLPISGNVFISVADRDKAEVGKIGQDLVKLGPTRYQLSQSSLAAASPRRCSWAIWLRLS